MTDAETSTGENDPPQWRHYLRSSATTVDAIVLKHVIALEWVDRL